MLLMIQKYYFCPRKQAVNENRLYFIIKYFDYV